MPFGGEGLGRPTRRAVVQRVAAMMPGQCEAFLPIYRGQWRRSPNGNAAASPDSARCRTRRRLRPRLLPTARGRGPRRRSLHSSSGNGCRSLGALPAVRQSRTPVQSGTCDRSPPRTPFGLPGENRSCPRTTLSGEFPTAVRRTSGPRSGIRARRGGAGPELSTGTRRLSVVTEDVLPFLVARGVGRGSVRTM